jgi:hypothetical protein
VQQRATPFNPAATGSLMLDMHGQGFNDSGGISHFFLEHSILVQYIHRRSREELL